MGKGLIITEKPSVAKDITEAIGGFESMKKGEYYLAELSGTYKKPDGPPFLQRTKDAPGYRMLAVMIPAEGGVYFLKLTGPDKTVAAQAKAFRRMFGADVKTEKPFGRS